jgi:hypothetical protein
VARYHSAVISKTADITSSHSAVVPKVTTWLQKTRMLPLKRQRRKKGKTAQLPPLKILTVNQPFFLYEYAGKSKMRLDDSKVDYSSITFKNNSYIKHKYDRPIDGKVKEHTQNGAKSSSL